MDSFVIKGKIYEGLNYKNDKLDIDLYEDFLSEEEAKELYEMFSSKNGYFSSKLGSKNTFTRRVNMTFGDDGVSYSVSFKNGTVIREAIPWKECPNLEIYRDRLSTITGNYYNYVVVQYYPTGKTMISPHRDKEMTHGTDIAGVSVGSTRTLQMVPPRWVDQSPVDIELSSRSLYILKPPTNDYWAHSILPNLEALGPEGGRVSLTYRYKE